jgi:hypothetical protein
VPLTEAAALRLTGMLPWRVGRRTTLQGEIHALRPEGILFCSCLFCRCVGFFFFLCIFCLVSHGGS